MKENKLNLTTSLNLHFIIQEKINQLFFLSNSKINMYNYFIDMKLYVYTIV